MLGSPRPTLESTRHGVGRLKRGTAFVTGRVRRNPKF